MKTIDLQNKTSAKIGKIEVFWSENKSIGLEKTIFHRMSFPLAPFVTGLDGEAETISTRIEVNWLNLNLNDPTEMDGLILKSDPADGAHITIEIAETKNPCDIKKMAISKVGKNLYDINCELFVDFDFGGIAKSETFSFKTKAELDPKIKEE